MTHMSVYNRLLPAILFLLSGIFFNNLCYSQAIIKENNPSEQVFLVRTKQFNEFLNRFNYKTTFSGDPVDSIFTSKISRGQMLNSLFNLKDPRIDPSGDNFYQAYCDAKTELINEIVQKKLLINKYSDEIIADAKSHIVYKGIDNTISVLLSQETVGRDMVKWVINDVKGDIFNFLQYDTVYIRFIPPTSHETDFMNLKRALEDVDYLQYYSSKNYKPEYLTLFYYMINSGLLKFEYVEEVTYHISDIPGWSITVKEFNRNEMNSGWLISDISKVSSN
jgi:hypothetical protein